MTDLAGNTASLDVTVNIDKTLPAAPIFDLDPVSDSEPIGDMATILDLVTLVGQTGATIVVDLLETAQTTTSDVDGRFEFAGVALALGPNVFTTRATDLAGNQSSFSETITRLSADAEPPQITATLANDTGQDNTDGLTFDPTITGTVTDDNGVAAFRAGLDLTPPSSFLDVLADLQPGGSFSLTPVRLEEIHGSAIPDGPHTLHLVAEDASGNASTVFNVAFTLDATPPDAPALPDMQAASDSGASDVDNVTNDSTPTVVVDADAGTTVQLQVDGVPVDQGVANGLLEFTTPPLSDGGHAITATAEDAAGNLSNVSPALDVTIDTQAPAPPSVLSLDDASDSGLSNSDEVTNVAGIIVEGNAETSALVRLFRNSQPVGEAIANNPWQISDVLAQDRQFFFDATAEDLAGNLSGLSNGLTVRFDTTAPVAAIDASGVLSQPVDAIDVSFNEAVNVAGLVLGDFSLRIDGGPDDGQLVPLSSFTVLDSSSVRLSLSGPLDDGNGYQLGVAAGVGDVAGNLSAAVDFSFVVAESFQVSDVSPANGELEVSPSREVIVRFSEEVDPGTVDAASLKFIALGEEVTGNRRVSSTNKFVTFFPAKPWPSSTEIRIVVDGNQILAGNGDPLDADGNGIRGGVGKADFRTLSLTRIPGTDVFGFVRDSLTQQPIVGATIRVDAFPEANVTTDANGRFLLEDMPAPTFFVHVDGSTATNAPAGFVYPNVGKPFHSVPGEAVQISLAGEPFDIFLPPMALTDKQPLSATQTTDVGFGNAGKAELVNMFPAVSPSVWDRMSVIFAPGAAVDENGNPAVEAAIIPVPPDRIPAPLPEMLQPSLVISIQTPGATNFDVPAPISFPNLDGLLPGDQTLLFSFDHDRGAWISIGTGTVSQDGLVIESDPGVGILAPGWHFAPPPRTRFDGELVMPWEDQIEDASESVNAEALNTETDILLAIAGNIPGPAGAIANVVSGVKAYAQCDAGDTFCKVRAVAGGVVGVAGSLSGAKTALAVARAGLLNVAGFVGNINTGIGLLEDAGKFKEATDKLNEVKLAAISHGADKATVTSSVDDMSQRVGALKQQYGDIISQALDQADQAEQIIAEIEQILDDGQGGMLDPENPNDEPEIRDKLDNGIPDLDPLPDFNFLLDVGDTFSDAALLNLPRNSQRLVFQRIGMAPQGSLDVDMYTFFAEAGDLISIGLRRSGGDLFRSHVRLFNSGGAAIAADTSSGPEYNPQILDFQIPTTGTYSIGVSGYPNTTYLPNVAGSGRAGATGPYTMLVQRASAPLSPGNRITSRLTNYTPSLLVAEDGVFGGLVSSAIALAQDIVDTHNTVLLPLTTMAPDGPVFVAFENTSTGQLTRTMSDGAGRVNQVLRPNTTYNLYLYDPVSNRATISEFTTGFSGSVVRPTPIILGSGALADTDGDKLVDLGEIAVGTSISNRDTDGDRISDFAELRQGLNPLNPASFPTGVIASLPLAGEAREIVVEGSTLVAGKQTAYVATGSHGLAVVDSSQFNNPIILGRLDLPGNATDVDVAASLNRAIVAANSGGLHLVDVSDPMLPALIDTIDVPANQVEVVDRVAYISSGASLQAYDLVTGEFRQRLFLSGGGITGLTGEGSFLYVMNATRNLQVVDFSGTDMVLRGSVTMPDGAGKIFAGNDIVYAAASNSTTRGGFATADVSDPDDPVVISGSDVPAIAREPGTAVVANGSGIGIVVGTPSQTKSHQIRILNISDPAQTNFELTQAPLPGSPSSVAVAAGIAFVAGGIAGLQVVNFLPFDDQELPPMVTISSPIIDADPLAPGMQVIEGTSVPIRAEVTDDFQLRNVSLRRNGQIVTNDVSFPFEFFAVAPDLSGGNTVDLQVTATDTGGNAADSNTLVFEIIPDDTPPAIDSITPADGAIRGINLTNVEVFFSEPLDEGTVGLGSFEILDSSLTPVPVNSLQLRNNDKLVQLTFDPLPEENYQIVIDGSVVTDRAGNALAAGDVVSTFEVIDRSIKWTNASGGLWSDPNNWDLPNIPQPFDRVVIDIDATFTVTVDTDVSVSELIVGSSIGVQTLSSSNHNLVIDGRGVLGQNTALSFAGGKLTVNDNFTADGQITLINTEVDGTGTFLVQPNATAFVSGTTFNSNLTNKGELAFQYSTNNVVNGMFVNREGGALRLRANSSVSSQRDVALTVAQGLLNGGDFVLENIGTSSGFHSVTFTDLSAGTLVVEPSGTVTVNDNSTSPRTTTINASIANQGEINIHDPLTINKVSAIHSNSGTINVLAGGLTVTGFDTFTNSGLFETAGGTLTVSASTSFTNAPSGQLTLTSGNMSFTGTGAWDNQGTVTGDASTLTLNSYATVLNSGTMNFPGGNFTMSGIGGGTNTGAIDLGTGRLWTLTNVTSLDNTTGSLPTAGTLTMTSSTINNTAGTYDTGTAVFNLSSSTLASSGTVTFGGNVTLTSGTIDADIVSSATLKANRTTGNTITGTRTNTSTGTVRIEANSNSSIERDSRLTVGTGVTNAGLLEMVNFGTVNTTNLAILNVTSGMLTNTGTGVIDVVDTSATAGVTRTINAAVDNQGTINLSEATTINGAAAAHANSGTINVLAGGLTVTGFNTFTNSGLIDGSGAGLNINTFTTLTNTATGNIDVAGGGVSVSGFTTLANNAGGTINVSGGNFALSGFTTVDNDGGIDIGTSRTMTVPTGTFEHDATTGSLGGDGAFSFTGGSTLSVTGAYTLPTTTTLNASTISSVSLFTVGAAKTLTMTNGTITADVTVDGTLLARRTTGNTITGTLTNNSTGTVRIETNSNSSVERDARLTVSAGVNNSGLLEMVNAGTSNGTNLVILNVTTGTLTNTGTGVIDVVDTSATIGVTRTINAAVDNQGTINVSEVTTINLSGATFNSSGTVTVASGQTLFVSGGTHADHVGGTLSGGTYDLAGVFKFDGAAITTNEATIVLDGSGAAIRDELNADALAALATNTAAGSFTIQGGKSFSSAGNFSNAGDVTTGSGSTVSVNGDYTQMAGSTVVDGSLAATGSINLQGGTLSGTGTVGNLNNAAGVFVGNSPGTLTVDGNYTQTVDGTLTVELGGLTAGTQFDVLAVTGTATLDGTLDVTLIDGFDALIAAGNMFQIMTFAASTPGAFATINTPNLPVGLALVQNVSASDVVLEAMSALHADGDATPVGNVASISNADLDAALTEAARRWRAAGTTVDLSRLAVQIGDLSGSLLGLANTQTIWIDDDAAGFGWFVDETPGLDEEFTLGAALATSPGHGRVDLLTVLAHEMGHALGLDDLTQQDGLDGVMNATLRPGVRRSPTAADLAAASIDAALAEDIGLEDALVSPLAKQLKGRPKGMGRR